MPRLSLSLLGRFEAKLDSEPLAAFRSDKERALLAYLAVEADRPHRREELAALLWGDLPEEAALNNLRKALHHLRQVLGDGDSANPFLSASSKTIQFNAADPKNVDVAGFSLVTLHAQGHRHRRPQTCQTCLGWLEEAARLYRGDLLQGFNLPDAIAFDEWLLVRREQLRQQALTALQRLTEFHERRGEFVTAQRYARQQVVLEPWHEIAHRQLMTVLARNGQRAAALAQFEACRKALQTELGVEPEAATIALYEKIKHGEPWPAQPGPLLNLPAQTTPFFGRVTELERLSAWLQNSDCRLVTLIGTGGVGKTRLALQAAHNLGYEFMDGVQFVPLAALRDPKLVVASIAQVIGIKVQGSQPVAEMLTDFLRVRDVLLILDNFEHLLDASPVVAELLAACPHLTILVTSREPLRLRGEQLYPVPPLDMPTSADKTPALQADNLLKYGAVSLFVQHARAAQPDFVFEGVEASAVVEVCRRLDGLPLAIELAAARVATLAPSAMVDQLDKLANSSLHLLTEGARDLPARQQTMRAAITWSYELLNQEEQLLFRLAGVFLGGWQIEALEALTFGTVTLVLERLESLVDKSLIIKLATAEPRYTMLETIREFAWDELTRAGQLADARRKHASYYSQFVEKAEPELTGPGQDDWLARLETDHDNLRAALGWASDWGEAELAQRLGGGLWRFWDMHGHIVEGRNWLERVLGLSGAVPPSVQAKALNGAGMLIWYLGDYEAARRRMTEALEIRRALNDKFGLAVSLNNLGMVAWSLGDYVSALTLYAECLAMDQANDDQMGQAYSYGNLGLVFHHQGRFAEAQANFEHSLSIFRSLGNKRHEAFALHNLGMVIYHLNDFDAARLLFEESLRLKEELSDKRGIASTLVYLANVTRAQGQPTHTRDLLSRSLHLRQELGDKSGLADTLDGVAALEASEGQGDKAIRLFGAAERLRRDSATTLHATDRLERDRNLTIARAGLDPVAFDTHWQAGQQITLEEAISLSKNELKV